MALENFINLALAGVNVRDRREKNIRDETFREKQFDFNVDTTNRQLDQRDTLQNFREDQARISNEQIKKRQAGVNRTITVGEKQQTLREKQDADIQQQKRWDTRALEVQNAFLKPDGTFVDFEDMMDTPLGQAWLGGNEDLADAARTLNSESIGITPDGDGFIIEGETEVGATKPVSRDRSSAQGDPAIKLSRDETQALFEFYATRDMIRGRVKTPGEQQAFFNSLPDLSTEAGRADLDPALAAIIAKLHGTPEGDGPPALESPVIAGLTQEELAVEAPQQLSDDELVDVQKRIKAGIKSGIPDVEALRMLKADPRVGALPRVLENTLASATDRVSTVDEQLSTSLENLKLLKPGPNNPISLESARINVDKAENAWRNSPGGTTRAESKVLRSAFIDAKKEVRRAAKRDELEDTVKRLEGEGKDATVHRKALFELTGRKSDAPGVKLGKSVSAKLSDFESVDKMNAATQGMVVDPQKQAANLQVLATNDLSAKYRERKGIATELYVAGVIDTPEDAAAYVRTGHWPEGSIISAGGREFYKHGDGTFQEIIDPDAKAANIVKKRKEQWALIIAKQGSLLNMAKSVIGDNGEKYTEAESQLLVSQVTATPGIWRILDGGNPLAAITAIMKTMGPINAARDAHNASWWASWFTGKERIDTVTPALLIHRLGLDGSSPDMINKEVYNPIRDVFGRMPRDTIIGAIAANAQEKGKIGGSWTESIRAAAIEFKEKNPGLK